VRGRRKLDIREEEERGRKIRGTIVMRRNSG
jgi:hypothetical protein